MANSKSALKRARQNVKRTARNRSVKSAVRRQVRKLREAFAAEEFSAETVGTELRQSTKALSKAASKGVLHKRTASRRISRLAKAANKAKAAAESAQG